MKRKIFSLLLAVALMGVFIAGPLVHQVEAGTLNDSYLFLERTQTSVASGVDMVLAFNPNQAFSAGGDVTITFGNDVSGDWCKTAGALEFTAVTSAAPDDGGTEDIDAGITGSPTVACAQGTPDTITITNVGALSAGTMYGIRIEDGVGTGVLGTDDTSGSQLVTINVTEGSNSDSSTYGIYLVSDDTVTISADVDTAPTVTCSVTGTTVSLGTLYAGGSFITNATTTDIAASTSNSGDGYYWAIYGLNGGLYTAAGGGDTLAADTGGTPVNLATTEGFGLRITDGASDTYVESDYKSATASSFGGYGSGFTNAVLAVSHVVTDTAVSNEPHDVVWGAKADTGAQVGSYSEDVTFICGGYY